MGSAYEVYVVQQILSTAALGLAACYGSVLTSLWTAVCFQQAVELSVYHGVAAITLLVEQGPWPVVLINGVTFAAQLHEREDTSHHTHTFPPAAEQEPVPFLRPAPDVPTIIDFV